MVYYWDPRISPLVLADIRCLYIPCAFVTHFGKCIDEKTPLLRSMDAVTVSGLRLLKAIGIGTDAKAGVLGGTCDVGHGGTWWDMVGHGGTWWHAVGWSGFVDFFRLQSSSGTVLRVVCCGSKKLKTWKAMRPSGHAELPGLGAGVLCDASWSLQGQAWPGELRPHLVRQVAHQTSAGRLELLPANPWQGAGRYDSAWWHHYPS